MDYRIQLDAYAGPLDLLLYLVKRHEIDLHDIPIADLTEQYLAHLKLIEHLDMDQAGEFLVMAATLLEIKSQMIVPQPEKDDDEQDSDESAATPPDSQTAPTDPRYELVQQLLAYKRYKDAARRLELRQDQWNARFAVRPVDRRKPEKSADAESREIELEDVNVMELCEAFAQLLNSIGDFAGHSVTDDDTPIGLHAEDIADRLKREGPMTLRAIAEGRNRAEIVGLFLAMLELVRDKRVIVRQAERGGDVELAMRDDAEAHRDLADDEVEVDWRDPRTGEIQYDWPDEEARRRYERRQQRRHGRFDRGEFTSDDEDEEADDLDDALDGEFGDADHEQPSAWDDSDAERDEESDDDDQADDDRDIDGGDPDDEPEAGPPRA